MKQQQKPAAAVTVAAAAAVEFDKFFLTADRWVFTGDSNLGLVC